MTVRQASPSSRVLDLTRRLAEDYDSIPLSDVSRAVKEAAATVGDVGKDIAAAVEAIEQVARQELLTLSA